MHEAVPPRSLSGAPFYDSVLTVADGVAIKTPLSARTPAEFIEIVGDAQPAAARRLRFPGRLKLRQ
jgi:hypothetical protein